jgi:hypothetical protein
MIYHNPINVFGARDVYITPLFQALVKRFPVVPNKVYRVGTLHFLLPFVTTL